MPDSDDDEALRLNTLHRFQKHSPRLLLQEYSHCEVPAGCGGVVLRWLDREQGLPVMLRVASLAPSGTATLWLDGRDVSDASTFELMAGEHVLALELADLPRPNTPLLVRLDINLPRDKGTLLRSTADHRWWVSTTEPADMGWLAPEFECTAPAWSRAIGHADALSELAQDQRWRWESLMREPYRANDPNLSEAARPLALPGTHVWLRAHFELGAVTIANRLAAAEERARG
jgi:hypothetical protein